MGARNAIQELQRSVLASAYAITRSHLFWIFILAQGLILAPFAYNHFALSEAILAENTTASIVNISGRQRMLSQRIAFIANNLVTAAESGEDTAPIRARLIETIDIMENGHLALSTGSAELGFDEDKIAPVQDIYFRAPYNLNALVQVYLADARRLAALDTAALTHKSLAIRRINIVATRKILPGLDAATKAFETAGSKAIKEIAELERKLWFLAFFTVLAELALIYWPVHRTVRRQFDRLETNERLFRSIYDSTPVMMMSLDEDATITEVSRFWLDQMGYARDRVIGKKLFDFMVDIDETADVGLLFGDTDGTGDATLQLIQSSGKAIDVSVYAERLIDHNGRFQRLVVAFVDVTEERRIRAELNRKAEALDNLQRLAFKSGIDYDTRIQSVLDFGNTFFGTTLGIVSRIKNDAYTVKYVAGDAEAPKPGTSFKSEHSYCTNVLHSDNPVGIENMRNTDYFHHPCYAAFKLDTYLGSKLRVNGKDFGTLNFTSPAPREDPFNEVDFTFMRLLAQWVSTTLEQATAREELQHAILVAEAANETKSAFLANMSHEIRTPLNAVIGLTELTLKTKLTEKQENYLSRVSTAGRNLLGLLNDILDFSKIEAGKLNLELIDFSLKAVMENLATVIAPRAEEKGLRIAFDEASNMPDWLHGDPLRIGQILINLAGNAVKFTGQGDITIAASASDMNDGRYIVTFSVTDSGIGMTPAQQAGLFKPFTQADTSTTRLYGGTGLGLSISAELVKAMNGEIWVESIPGEGSTFTFWIPLAKGDPVAQAFDSGYISEIAQTLRILVVDDNAASLDIISDPLRRIGAVTETANTSVTAIDKFQDAIASDAPYDLVILDWQMPGINGLETAERIREIENGETKTFIIVISAYDVSEAAASFEALGITQILTKPVDMSLLLNLIANHFAGRAPAETERKKTATSQPEAHSQRSARLLLAEDNELNQMVAIGILEGAGYIVDVVENGKEAINRLNANGPHYYDAVLMDIQMPEMDGITATKTIREDRAFAALPIIAMTAHAMKEEQDRCLQAGMIDHVSKPVDASVLLTTIAKHIAP